MIFRNFPSALALRLLMFAAPAIWVSLPAGAQSASQSARNADEAMNRALASENRLLAKLKTVQPVIETYIQQMQPDEDLGSIPKNDNYFLGKLDLTRQISHDSFIPAPGFLQRSLGVFTHFVSPEFLPRG